MEVPNKPRSEVCHVVQVVKGNRSNSFYIALEVDVREPGLNRSLLRMQQPYSLVVAYGVRAHASQFRRRGLRHSGRPSSRRSTRSPLTDIHKVLDKQHMRVHSIVG